MPINPIRLGLSSSFAELSHEKSETEMPALRFAEVTEALFVLGESSSIADQNVLLRSMRRSLHDSPEEQGSVVKTREIPLTKGLVALVSAEDFDRVNAFKWCASQESAGGAKWYAVRFVTINGRQRKIRMHRFIVGLDHRHRRVVDHLNSNGLDNRRENLEVVTQKQNMKRAQASGWGPGRLLRKAKDESRSQDLASVLSTSERRLEDVRSSEQRSRVSVRRHRDSSRVRSGTGEQNGEGAERFHGFARSEVHDRLCSRSRFIDGDLLSSPPAT